MGNTPPTYRFEQFAAVIKTTGIAFAPDGGSITYISNRSGQLNLWRHDLTTHEAMPLTEFQDEAVRNVAWSPDGRCLLFSADRLGNEYRQLYRWHANAAPEPLTQQPKVQYSFSSTGWSPDSRYLAHSANARVAQDMDVMLLDLHQNTHTMLLGGDANYHPVSWSPDQRTLVVLQSNRNTDNDLYLLDVATRAIQHITPHDDDTVFYPGPWAPDGSGLYLISNAGREFLGLAFWERSSSSLRWIETPDWDVMHVDLSADGRRLLWTVNQGGYAQLWLHDLQDGTTTAISLPAAGVIADLRFSPSGDAIAWYLESAGQPNDLYLYTIATQHTQRLTESHQGGIPAHVMTEPRAVAFPTFDGRQIPAWLFRPRQASATQRVPAVLAIHGGPESQELPRYLYAGLYQYLLHSGIAILAPNIRGSTGYGKGYQRLIHRDFGGDDLKDLDAARQYLQNLDWIDPTRLGVFGASYGGFATLSCATRLPQYWAAAVDVVGPSNLVTLAQSVPPFWRRFMKEWVGDPEEDRERLIQRSPLTYVEQLRCPLLIIQGANDPRVVKNESDQIVARLRELGRTVDYLVFDDEGHGFTKRANEVRAYGAAAEFFVRHLLSI